MTTRSGVACLISMAALLGLVACGGGSSNSEMHIKAGRLLTEVTDYSFLKPVTAVFPIRNAGPDAAEDVRIIVVQGKRGVHALDLTCAPDAPTGTYCPTIGADGRVAGTWPVGATAMIQIQTVDDDMVSQGYLYQVRVTAGNDRTALAKFRFALDFLLMEDGRNVSYGGGMFVATNLKATYSLPATVVAGKTATATATIVSTRSDTDMYNRVEFSVTPLAGQQYRFVRCADASGVTCYPPPIPDPIGVIFYLYPEFKMGRVYTLTVEFDVPVDARGTYSSTFSFLGVGNVSGSDGVATATTVVVGP